MSGVVIVSWARTPIGKLGGALARATAPQLGATAIRAALARAGVDGGLVDEVIMGNVLSAGMGQAPARQASMGAGIPVAARSTTVNKVCASGMKAISLAAQSIALGHADGAVAGGISQGEIHEVRRRLERRSVKARRDEDGVNRDLFPQ